MTGSPFITATQAAPTRLLATALGVALVSSGSVAAANDIADDGGDSRANPHRNKADIDSDAETSTLETVEVAGHYPDQPSSPKFTAPLLDTPKSVTIVPLAVIEGTASTTLIEALRNVPGITFGAGEGGNPVGDRPFIRGFDSATDIYLDGVRDTGSQSREAFAIESIEVIKGPSSAYGGRGSAGGSINLVTKAPTRQNFVAGSVGIGSDAYRRATVDANTVLSDSVALRVNLMRHDADVPGRNGPDTSRWGIAPSITFGMDSATRATLSYYHLDTDNTPDSGIPYNNPFSATSPNASLNGDGRPVHVPRDAFYGLLDRDFLKGSTDSGFVRIEHEFDNGFTLRNTSAGGRSSNDYIWTQPDDSKGNILLNGQVWRRTNTRTSSTNTAANQTELSGEFATGALQHHFSSGIELSHEKNQKGRYQVETSTRNPGTGSYNPDSNYTLCPPMNGSDPYNCTDLFDPNPHDPWHGSITRAPNVTRTRTRTASVYAFDTIDLSERWLLNLGLRHDDYSTRAVTPTYVNATTGATVVTPTLSNDTGFWNSQVGLVYKPAANGSVYVSWATSSTPTGNNTGDGSDNIAVTTADLAPERNRNIQLGSKWDLLDQRLSLTAAVFRGEKSNARVQIDASTYALAGEQRVNGVELGVNGKLGEGWSVFAGYTFLDSELVDTGSFRSNAANAGNRFPNTPKHSASLWTTWQLLPNLTVGGGAYYMDKVYGNVANTKWVPGYTRFDAMAAYTLNEHINLQLNVQNLGDRTYYDKAYASHYASMAPGRSAILSANLRF